MIHRVLTCYRLRSTGLPLILVPDGWTTEGGIVRVNPLTAGGPANSIAAQREEYVNPYSNEIEVGTNQYPVRWQNSLGDVIYTDDQYYDPITDINLQLTKDFRLSEVRPRGPAQ